MRSDCLHSKYRKTLTSTLSFVLIAVFFMLGFAMKQASYGQLSEVQRFEKCKKNYSDSDLLLFEEDEELSDDNKDGQEWMKGISFGLVNGSNCYDHSGLHYTAQPDVALLQNNVPDHVPFFISIHSLRI